MYTTAELPTPSWNLTGLLSVPLYGDCADVGPGIRLIPIKLEISRESLQRPKDA